MGDNTSVGAVYGEAAADWLIRLREDLLLGWAFWRTLRRYREEPSPIKRVICTCGEMTLVGARVAKEHHPELFNAPP